jgi:hypothetical protein
MVTDKPPDLATPGFYSLRREANLTAETSEKPKFRNQIVPCNICKQEFKRKHLVKHKLAAHAGFGAPLILNTKAETKSPTFRACFGCNAQNVETWLFKDTSRGPVHLCDKCKRHHIKNSFSHEGMEKKRLMALKATLKELREMLRNQAFITQHPRLKKEILELEIAIQKPPTPRPRWSPILPGSFESGKRR